METASKRPRFARELYWFGWRRPEILAREARRLAAILPRILDTVSKRTMMRKDPSDLKSDLPGLDKTIPLAGFREVGWFP